MFNTETVMKQIREELQNSQAYQESASYITSYFHKCVARLKKEESVVIFGCGIYGKAIYDGIVLEGVANIKCFCDNNKNFAGTSYKGCEVLLPEEALGRYPNACFVVTPAGYENEILVQLSDMGISARNIFIMNISLSGLICG